jgi:MFS superfamily sulfate permease-like transporter
VLERVVWFVTALVTLCLAFFFLAAAVVVGAVLAAVLLARIWWLSRKARKTAEQSIITTEYTVVEREPLPQISERHSRGNDEPH